jgi:hypothetical protein
MATPCDLPVGEAVVLTRTAAAPGDPRFLGVEGTLVSATDRFLRLRGADGDRWFPVTSVLSVGRKP